MDNSIKLFAGSSHPELGQLVAKRLGIELSNVILRKFSNQVRDARGADGTPSRSAHTALAMEACSERLHATGDLGDHW